mgnify:CR=1 FL=1
MSEPKVHYEVDGPVNLNRLSAVVDLADRPDLKFPPFTPGTPPDLAHGAGVMAAMSRRDVLLHHPYQSFTTVIEFLEEAAADPDVLAAIDPDAVEMRADVEAMMPEVDIAGTGATLVTIEVDESAVAEAQKTDVAQQPADPDADKSSHGNKKPGKKEPGKLPKFAVKQDAPKDTQEAAQQVLRKLFNRS